MKWAVILLAGTALSSNAWALDQCNPSPADKQVRICVYNPLQRYAVHGVVGFPVNLTFGPKETIKRSEFAYTGVDKDGKPVQEWTGPQKQVEKTNGNDQGVQASRFMTNLPVWALHPGHSALVVVTTFDNGTEVHPERTYLFDLTAKPPSPCGKEDPYGPGCEADTTTTSAITFLYPLDDAAERAKAEAARKAAAATAWVAQQKVEKEQVAVARLKTDVFYGKDRNWKYHVKGEDKYKFLAPSKVSDNGWLTALEWPQNVQMPTVLIIDPVTGEPHKTPYTQQGHQIIVATTAAHWRLVLGDTGAVMDLFNDAWSPNRPNPETGTTSPDVARNVIYADGKPQ